MTRKRSTARIAREAEMREVLALRDQDGLSYAELSTRTGIPVPRLLYWNRKLREPSPFVEVDIGSATEPPRSQQLEIILLSGRRVLVPERFDKDTLRELVVVLEDE